MEIVCLPGDLDLRTLSHELRTPLVPILGFAYQLLETELTPEQKDCINHLLEAGNQLVNLADKLNKTKKVMSDDSLTDDELQNFIQKIQAKNKVKQSNLRLFR